MPLVDWPRGSTILWFNFISLLVLKGHASFCCHLASVSVRCRNLFQKSSLKPLAKFDLLSYIFTTLSELIIVILSALSILQSDKIRIIIYNICFNQLEKRNHLVLFCCLLRHTPVVCSDLAFKRVWYIWRRPLGVTRPLEPQLYSHQKTILLVPDWDIKKLIKNQSELWTETLQNCSVDGHKKKISRIVIYFTCYPFITRQNSLDLVPPSKKTCSWQLIHPSFSNLSPSAHLSYNSVYFIGNNDRCDPSTYKILHDFNNEMTIYDMVSYF